MKVTVNHLYSDHIGGTWWINENWSVPEREVADETAEEWMKVLEILGAKRYTHKNQTVYVSIGDCRHCIHYIFEK